MDVLQFLMSGFLIGWAVAWPPGPINAEIARRCLARGFWAGFGLILGAATGDALWALLVAFGIGTIFVGPRMQTTMGIVSIFLLLALAFTFLRGAWLAATEVEAATSNPSRFDSSHASFLLGFTMALTSPWNVAFWLATIGRPEITQFGRTALAAVILGVILGALAWGLVWSATTIALRRRVDSEAAQWWTVAAKGITGGLMLWFAIASMRALPLLR